MPLLTKRAHAKVIHVSRNYADLQCPNEACCHTERLSRDEDGYAAMETWACHVEGCSEGMCLNCRGVCFACDKYTCAEHLVDLGGEKYCPCCMAEIASEGACPDSLLEAAAEYKETA